LKKIEMTQEEIVEAKKRLAILTTEFGNLTPLMRGSIVSNGRRHPQPYFSLNKNGRTHGMYLGERRLPAAIRMTANYARAIEIIDEMTLINMALLKNDQIE